jgi:glucose/arabinose dehydrogenase
MTAFALDEERVWGRPTGITITQDGAMLVSEDANGTIYRVTPEPK